MHDIFTALPKMPQRVELWLLVELVDGIIHNDGSIQIVAHKSWSALFVQTQIPIRPTSRPVLQVIHDVFGVILSTRPIAHARPVHQQPAV